MPRQPDTPLRTDAATDVPVTTEVLQQLDLTQSSLRKDLLAEHIGDLFDGHTFAGCSIRCGASVVSAEPLYNVFATIPDDAVCALTQLFCDGVSFVNNEILIEDLEGLAPSQVPHICYVLVLLWVLLLCLLWHKYIGQLVVWVKEVREDGLVL